MCAPGSPRIATASAISSADVSSRRAALFDVNNPANGERIARVSQGTSEDVEAAVASARKAFAKWSALSGDERARHLYALARHVQKRERFLAVLESIDNGKPIRESRDIDMPLVARHFYHHAGWASLIAERIPGPSPGRRLRPDHSVEFPAADAGVEDRAGARGRQYGGAEAGRIHAADRARFRRDLRRGRAAARRRQHRHRRRRDRRGARRPSGRRQDRLHRLDRGRARHSQGDRRHGQEAVARTRRQVAVHRLRGRRSRQRGRRRRRRDLVQPGPGLLRRLAAAGGGSDRGEISSPSCARAWPLCGSAIRSTNRPTSARSSPRCSSSASGAGRSRASARARRCWQRGRRAADARLLLSADAGHRRRARLDARAGRDLRPGAGGDDASARPTKRSRSPTTPATASPPRCGRRTSIARSKSPARIKAGVVWINSTNLFDAAAGFGGYRESGFGREGGREGLAEYLVADAPKAKANGKAHARRGADRAAGPGAEPARDAIDRTAKLYIGGKQARPDSGYSYAVLDRKGAAVGLAGLGNRKDIRNAVEAASKAGELGRGDRAQPRAGAVLPRRESRSARRRIRGPPARA